jgi:hypothetical protein
MAYTNFYRHMTQAERVTLYEKHLDVDGVTYLDAIFVEVEQETRRRTILEMSKICIHRHLSEGPKTEGYPIRDKIRTHGDYRDMAFTMLCLIMPSDEAFEWLKHHMDPSNLMDDTER